MPKKIPKYVQVLNKDTPPDDLKDNLIKAYELDGIIIDDEMKKSNPNAKQKIISITNTPPKTKIITSGNEKFDGHSETKTDWLYCGYKWYVRKIDEEYQFARYLAYNTETKKTEDPWDESVFMSKNKNG